MYVCYCVATFCKNFSFLIRQFNLFRLNMFSTLFTPLNFKRKKKDFQLQLKLGVFVDEI